MNTKYGVGSFGVGTVIVSGGDEWEGGWRLQALCSLTVINKIKQHILFIMLNHGWPVAIQPQSIRY